MITLPFPFWHQVLLYVFNLVFCCFGSVYHSVLSHWHMVLWINITNRRDCTEPNMHLIPHHRVGFGIYVVLHERWYWHLPRSAGRQNVHNECVLTCLIVALVVVTVHCVPLTGKASTIKATSDLYNDSPTPERKTTTKQMRTISPMPNFHAIKSDRWEFVTVWNPRTQIILIKSLLPSHSLDETPLKVAHQQHLPRHRLERQRFTILCAPSWGLLSHDLLLLCSTFPVLKA